MNSAIVVSIFFAVFCTVLHVALAKPNYPGVQQSANDKINIDGIGNQFSSLVNADVNANAQVSALDGLLASGVPVPALGGLAGLGGLGGLPGLGGLGGLGGLPGLGGLGGLAGLLGGGGGSGGLLNELPIVGGLVGNLPIIGDLLTSLPVVG